MQSVARVGVGGGQKNNEEHSCWVVEADKDNEEWRRTDTGSVPTCGPAARVGFDWITNTSIELAHTPIRLGYINWASTRINWTSTHIKSS